MTIKEYSPTCVDYESLVYTIEKLYGIDIYDFKNSLSPNATLYKQKLLEENNDDPREAERVFRIERPYLNFWHTICKNIVQDSENRIYIGDTDKHGERRPEWVCKINRMVRNIVDGHPAYNRDTQEVNCYVAW